MKQNFRQLKEQRQLIQDGKKRLLVFSDLMQLSSMINNVCPYLGNRLSIPSTCLIAGLSLSILILNLFHRCCMNRIISNKIQVHQCDR